MTEEFQKVSSFFMEMNAEPVARFAEFVSSLLSWTLVASAHRAKFGGIFEYDSYTSLNFLLACGIVTWVFSMGVVAARQLTLLEPLAQAKLELRGSAFVAFWMLTGAVAGAASSTLLHDEFGAFDSSVCHPRPHASSSETNKAQYFCSRVDAGVAFAFFAAVASLASLTLVFRKQTSAMSSSDDSHRDAYNPIGTADDDSGRTFAPFHGGKPMGSVGSDDAGAHHDAAVDL